MKITVLGSDGYLGFPLVLKLLARGHEVIGVDNLSRRNRVREMGCHSAVPLPDPHTRVAALREEYPNYQFRYMDLRHGDYVNYLFKKHIPDAVVHLAEIPSAPFSMRSRELAIETYTNNTVGTLNLLFAMRDYAPDCRMVKLGTMGVYGTKNKVIPEAPPSEFPLSPGSFYHGSKAADSINCEFASNIWSLGITDIHQGVVYGIITEDMMRPCDCLEREVDDRLVTRFDFDETWSTCINRFTAQAVIGHKLTPYGKGGQTRGYIALRDSMQCLTIVLENPPDVGEFRTFHQLDECYTVMELAEKVQKVGNGLGLNVEIWDYVENPRIEEEAHEYEPASQKLRELGFKPTLSIEEEMEITMKRLLRYKDRIEEKRHHIMPKTWWDPRKKGKS